MHDEKTRPLRTAVRFLWRFGDHQQGLPGTGRELLRDVAQQPAAPPGTGRRPENDQVAVVFRRGVQDGIGRIAPAHVHSVRYPSLLSQGRNAGQDRLMLRHDTVQYQRGTTRDVWQPNDERGEKHRQDRQLRPGISCQCDGILRWGHQPTADHL